MSISLRCFQAAFVRNVTNLNAISTETDVTYIRRRYHVEDHIATGNVPRDGYGSILHFVLMPIFSIHLHYFFNELMRLSGLMVLYYRLTQSALSALVKTFKRT